MSVVIILILPRFLETRFGAGGASLPFILGGFVLGGLLGQTMYNVFSFEMMNRVLKEDPKGEAARRIRKYYDLREDAR